LKKQISRPVLWHNIVMQFLKEKEIKKFTEIGTGRVLTGLLKRTARQEGFNIETYNIRDLEDLNAIYKN
jgi:malonyl CoA-acyl carrier protein transacylase